MTTGLLILTTLLKILFILAIVVGAFAPMLVWAERRQSAMMQDRVGPHRAGIQLPKGAVGPIRAMVLPMKLGAKLLGVLGVASLGGLVLMMLGFEAPGGLTPGQVFGLGVGSLVVGGALDIGSKVHGMLADNGGNITLAGLLHPLADALKFIWKEDFVPPKADKLLHSLAPIIALIPAVAVFAVIPFADVLHLELWDQVMPRNGMPAAETTAVPMQVANLNVGILFLFAIAGTGIIGAAVAGYASDNKFSLIGGVRAASQMVSYEVAMGLTLVPCFMMFDTLRLEQMVVWQHENGIWGICIFPLTIAFFLFFTAAIAETKRIPFDLPEGESELVGGYLTEYSGMKFGMFFMSEFIEVVGLAAVTTVIFLGGWDVPFLFRDGFDIPGTNLDAQFAAFVTGVPFSEAAPGIDATGIAMAHWGVIAIQVGAMLAKIVVLIWFQLLTRWSLPRFRYDQMMMLCWKGLLPASLVNILFTGIIILLGDGAIAAAKLAGWACVIGGVIFFTLPPVKKHAGSPEPIGAAE